MWYRLYSSWILLSGVRGDLGVSIIWSTLVLFLIYTERAVNSGLFIVLDLALAAVHYSFGIINALAASSTEYGHGNAIVAMSLLVAGVLHIFFFGLACRDTHVRRTSTISEIGKDGLEAYTV
ncbi:hypothetical protein N7522_002704 [Penicillium canescens]|nr:hypothetical protein N7522_002704 [Penicillium canescens]